MKKIFYIEDKLTQARLIKRRLERIFNEPEFDLVIICPPYKTMEEFLPHLSDPNTICIIIDENLVSEVTFRGTELAGFLRSVDPKKPIYILTSVASVPDSPSVEAVIDKRELDESPNVIKARMLRRFDTYQDLVETRYQRYHGLIRKSLDQRLSDDEYHEIQELGFLSISSSLAQEIEKLEEIDKLLDKQNEILQKLEDGEKSHE